MVLKRDTDYAVRLLAHYAQKQAMGDRFCFRRDTLHETGIPAQAHSRICRLLRDNGYLEAQTHGRDTGYRLAVSPDEITLKDVIALTETSTELLSLFDRRAPIYHHAAWKGLQNRLDRDLESITIAMLIQDVAP